MKTLYKLDSKGKIRVWNIWTEDDVLIQEAGIWGGKLVQHRKTCTPKNVGKSNETTGEVQALLELDSEYKAKLTEGYFTDIKLAKNTEVILPMLAKNYNDERKKINWIKDKVYIQPKLDGMRCLAIIKNNKVTLMSRDGKLIQNLEHIQLSLSFIMEDCVLDGEVYAHGLSFQENMKLIKKYRPGETEKIQYHIYDLVSGENFTKRFNKAQKLIEGINNTQIVSTMAITEEIQIANYHSSNLNLGYEGSIIRWGEEGYKLNGRSSNLLKYKDFQDITAEIIDIIPNEADPTQGTPVLKYKASTFKAGVKLSHEERKELLTNKANYIGKMAEIRFFEWTDEGNPRFPIMVGIRLDC